jgi:hypothetical protein
MSGGAGLISTARPSPRPNCPVGYAVRHWAFAPPPGVSIGRLNRQLLHLRFQLALQRRVEPQLARQLV